MNYGFDNGRFYVEHSNSSRLVSSVREESMIMARSIYNNSRNIFLCVSTGLDSQIAAHSFSSQGLPINYVFFKQGSRNITEFNNVKLLEKKFNIKIDIIDIDPDTIKDEVLSLSLELDVHPNHALHYIFCKELPLDYDLIQVVHDPWIITDRKTEEHYVYHGFYDPEIARSRALEAIPGRTGKIHTFGSTSEFFLSLLQNNIFKSFLESWKYYNGNNLTHDGVVPHDVYRYDYYIKPLIYASNWGNELLYFPKFMGYENIDWIKNYSEDKIRKTTHHCFIKYSELINLYTSPGKQTKRYYQN